MDRFLFLECKPKQMSPLSLAFIGDTVFDLFVRETLVCENKMPVKKLHSLAVEEVRASSQSDRIKDILPQLSDEEIDIFKSGRNAHTGHIPKSASIADYHNATGLETLFGYLYLEGKIERLREIFSLIHNS